MALLPIEASCPVRVATAAAWTSANTVLTSGEKGRESDTGKEKTGDGTTAWTSLQYDAGPLPTAANQYEASLTSPGRELRTDVKSLTFSAGITADGTYTVGIMPSFPMSLTTVKHKSVGDTCSIKIAKNGSDIDGFTSPVSVTTSVASVSPSGVTFASQDVVTVIVSSSGGSLTGLCLTFNCTRTGN